MTKARELNAGAVSPTPGLASIETRARTLRILVVGLNAAPELIGIGKYTGEMARWLNARGHAVEMLAAPPHYPDWRVQNGYRANRYAVSYDGAVRIQRCPLYVPARPSGNRRILHHLSFAASSLPAALLRATRFKPDVVVGIAPSLLSASVALQAARVAGARTWLHVQDLEVDAAFDLGMLTGERKRRAALTLERRLMCRFDRVSAISGRMADRVVEKGVPAERVSVFSNWVDCRHIRPLPAEARDRESFGLPRDGIVALYSGSLGRKQSIDVLVDAAEDLAPLGKVHIALFGQGPMTDEIEAAAARLPNLHIGNLVAPERLNDLLNCADIHLLPQSPYAADLVLPSKLTGMLASGRPIVATAAADTSLFDMVQGCGLAIPENTRAAFAQAIKSLAESGARRRHLGEAARSKALAQLDRATVLEHFEHQLARLTGDDTDDEKQQGIFSKNTHSKTARSR